MADNINTTDEAADPLDDLFVDETAVDRERLASILNGYADIGQETGRLVTTPEYDELAANEKIVVTLAAERAKELKGAVDSASMGPAAISKASGVAEGTVKPGVRDLADEGLIYDGEDGYSIEPPELKYIENWLESDD